MVHCSVMLRFPRRDPALEHYLASRGLDICFPRAGTAENSARFQVEVGWGDGVNVRSAGLDAALAMLATIQSGLAGGPTTLPDCGAELDVGVFRGADDFVRNVRLAPDELRFLAENRISLCVSIYGASRE